MRKTPRAWNSTLPRPTEPMNRGKGMKTGGPVNPKNHKRLARLRAEQFGTDGKREWIMRQPSALTGREGSPDNPMDPAHVLGTRGAGAGPKGMAPLLRTEHIDFDGSMTDKRFSERYGGRTREDVRQRARELEEEWQGE